MTRRAWGTGVGRASNPESRKRAEGVCACEPAWGGGRHQSITPTRRAWRRTWRAPRARRSRAWPSGRRASPAVRRASPRWWRSTNGRCAAVPGGTPACEPHAHRMRTACECTPHTRCMRTAGARRSRGGETGGEGCRTRGGPRGGGGGARGSGARGGGAKGGGAGGGEGAGGGGALARERGGRGGDAGGAAARGDGEGLLRGAAGAARTAPHHTAPHTTPHATQKERATGLGRGPTVLHSGLQNSATNCRHSVPRKVTSGAPTAKC